jgi:hypothetical protein
MIVSTPAGRMVIIMRVDSISMSVFAGTPTVMDLLHTKKVTMQSMALQQHALVMTHRS